MIDKISLLCYNNMYLNFINIKEFMMKKILLITFTAALSSCSLQSANVLNFQFLEPISGLLFEHSSYSHSNRYMFDAKSHTVFIESKQGQNSINGTYKLQLVANPTTNQAIYLLSGALLYDGLYLGIEIENTAPKMYRAKITIQNSAVRARDAITIYKGTDYTSKIFEDPALYRLYVSGDWVKTTAAGVYNGEYTEIFRALYNKENSQDHTLEIIKINGIITNKALYTLTPLSNVSDNTAVYRLAVPTGTTAGDNANEMFGFTLNFSEDTPKAQFILQAPEKGNPDQQELNRLSQDLEAIGTWSYIPFAIADRPERRLSALQNLGPWTYTGNGNQYDYNNSYTWEINAKDQIATYTTINNSGSLIRTYAMKKTSHPTVFQLDLIQEKGTAITTASMNRSGSAYAEEVFPYFTYQINDENTAAKIVTASSVNEAEHRLSSSRFLFSPLYSAPAVNYTLKIPTDTADKENSVTEWNTGRAGLSSFVFQKEGKVFIYALSGVSQKIDLNETAHDPTTTWLTTVHRSDDKGKTWTTVDAGATTPARAFQGQTFIYKDEVYVYDSTIFKNPGNINPPYDRLHKSKTLSGDWTPMKLPIALTNRGGATIFVVGDSITITGGVDYDTATSTYQVQNDTWQSFDGGTTWNKVKNDNSWSAAKDMTAIVIGQDVFLIHTYTSHNTPQTKFTPKIYKSSDRGLTWTQVSSTMPFELTGDTNGRIPATVIGKNIIILDPASGKFYMSSDGARTWVEQYTANAENSAITTSGSFATSMQSIDNTLILLGGQTATAPSAKVYRRILEK